MIPREKKSKHLFKFAAILVLLLIILLESNCSSRTGPLKNREITFSISIRYIQNLIDDGFYILALTRIESLLNESASHFSDPQIYKMASESSEKIGYKNDSQYFSNLANILEEKDYLVILNEKTKKEIFSHLNNVLSNNNTRHDQYSSPIDEIDSIEIEQEPDILISNVWYETGLTQVLLDISQETGIPIIWDNSVQGIVTYEANNQSISQVLDDILFTSGNSYIYQNGRYFVGTLNPEKPNFGKISKTYTIQLANISATDAKNLISNTYLPYVKAVNSTNTVSITAPPPVAERIIEDFRTIDSPGPQIEIQVYVVEFSTSDMKEFGIDWDVLMTGDGIDQNYKITSPELENAILSLSRFKSNGLSINSHKFDLTTAVKALEDRGIAKIRTAPRLRTISGRSAILEATKEQYFFITSGSGEDQYQYFGMYNRLENIQAGIQLMITPYADKNGYITVNLKPKVDDVVGKGVGGLPEISRRTAQTVVRVKDGETFGIGGLRTHEMKEIKRRVPFLGNIPVIGSLFGRTDLKREEKELMIFITPHILRY